MKWAIVAGVALALILLGVFVSHEVPLALLFGWIWFLARVVPRMTIDGPSILVGVVALALLAASSQWLGRAWSRHSNVGNGGSRRWRWRWSLSIAGVVVLLFAAGTAIVGAIHQTGWLLTSTEPLLGTRLNSWGSSRDRLRMLALAAHNYHHQFGVFPQGGTTAADGVLVHSWETCLLPYLPYDSRGIHKELPWNHPTNQPIFRSVLFDFINPDFRTSELTDAEGFGLSHYAANSRVLSAKTSMSFADISDGASTTILFGEVNTGFKPWGDPRNWRDPARGIGASPQTFGGPRSSGGALFAMCDGSVRFVSQKTSRRVLEALATPAGGEELTEEELGEKR